MEESKLEELLKNILFWEFYTLGSGGKTQSFFFSKFYIKKSEEKSKGEMGRKDNALGIYNNLVKCFI